MLITRLLLIMTTPITAAQMLLAKMPDNRAVAKYLAHHDAVEVGPSRLGPGASEGLASAFAAARDDPTEANVQALFDAWRQEVAPGKKPKRTAVELHEDAPPKRRRICPNPGCDDLVVERIEGTHGCVCTTCDEVVKCLECGRTIDEIGEDMCDACMDRFE